MTLFYPLKPLVITQPFGVNGDYYRKNGIQIKGHNGIDFLAKHGQPIYAAHDGTAYFEIDSSQGYGVVVRSVDQMEYEGEKVFYKTIYWHFVDHDKEPQFKSPISANGKGHPVRVGDILGYANSSGLSTGDHLHFALKPQGKNEDNGIWYNLEQNNGYLGCIDPIPYFNGLFAEDIFRYTFNNDLEFGQTSPEVKKLQYALQAIGYFPPEQSLTEYYGNVTRSAVFKFQIDYVASLSWRAWIAVWGNLGKYCSSLTRMQLNKIFS